MVTKGFVIDQGGEVHTYENIKQSDKKLSDRPDIAVLWQTPLYANQTDPGADRTRIYVGDIISDETGRGPMVCVPNAHGTLLFLYLDCPQGSHVIGCPWTDVWAERATILGNVYQNMHELLSPVLAKVAIQALKVCNTLDHVR